MPSFWLWSNLRSTPSLWTRGVFEYVLLEEKSGFLSFTVSGKQAKKTFELEAGGHRWQRIPPTEKKGRVHTSTITVAVLDEPTETILHLEEKDIEWTTCRGSGAGGQHRNRTESAVQMTHLPTGIRVRVENERSQHQNRDLAHRLLRARVYELRQAQTATVREEQRRSQVGSGMRGDKIRTIRVQDGIVTDHRKENKIRYKDYIRGNWDGLL